MNDGVTNVSFDMAVTNEGAPSGAKNWEVVFRKDSNSTKLEPLQLAQDKFIKQIPLDHISEPRIIRSHQLLNQIPTKLYKGGVLSGILMVKTKELTWDAFDRGTFTVSFTDDFGNRYSQTIPDMPQSPPPPQLSPTPPQTN
jgi:hypothetical protein